jgi:cell division protein FtsI (penicillin-binding protein 3)
MTIANNGVKIDPKLIKSYVDQDGNQKTPDAGGEKRVISEQTALQLQSMLQGVVSDGTGKKAAIPGL